MKKRNVLMLVLALVLVAALAVGGTLAYFTDKDEASNTFTMGHVDIDLQESENGTTWVDDGLTYQNIVPGDVTDKKARVTVNQGSENCYVMVKVTITGNNSFTLDTGHSDALYAAVVAAIDKTKWEVTPATGGPLQCVYKGATPVAGVANSDRIAKAGDQLMLFERITIPKTFGNEVADKSFSIKLEAFAIQSDNVDYDTEVTWNPTDFADYVEPQA